MEMFVFLIQGLRDTTPQKKNFQREALGRRVAQSLK